MNIYAKIRITNPLHREIAGPTTNPEAIAERIVAQPNIRAAQQLRPTIMFITNSYVTTINAIASWTAAALCRFPGRLHLIPPLTLSNTAK
jgi:hypothetical protein